MDNRKEQFRNFKKSLLVYFAMDAPTIEYENFDKKLDSPEDLPEEPMSDNEFRAKKRKALAVLKKIHLDAKLTETSEAEKKLNTELGKYIENQFKLLEHNYQKQLEDIGRNEEAAEVKKNLNKSVDNFIFKMEMHVLNESISFGNPRGALAVEIRLIDRFTKVKGFGRHFIAANPGDIENLIRSNPKNRKEFNKKLEELLDDEDKLEYGIKNMIGKTPKFKKLEDKDKVKEEFKRLISISFRNTEKGKKPKESLTYHIGKTQWYKLQRTFARRFDVKFIDGKPDHYIDLMDNNRVYKPGDEIMKVLLKLSRQSSFRSSDKLENYNEKIDKKEDAQAELHEELLSGFFWSADKEVTGLSTLRNNSKLKKLIRSAEKYDNAVNKEAREMNEQLAKLDELDKTPAINKLKRQLTAKNIKANYPALRSGGGLMALIQLIRLLAGNEDEKENTGALDEVSAGIDRGENPAEEAKKSEERYKANLPKASVTDLFEAYTKPKSNAAEKLFAKKGDKKVDKYAKTVLPKVIKEHLKDKLGFTKLINIKPTGKANEYYFNFKKGDKLKMFTIGIEGKQLMVKYNDDDKEHTKTVDNNLGTLKKALEGKLTATKKVKAKEAKNKLVNQMKLPTFNIDPQGRLKNIFPKTKIHDVITPKKYSEVVIQLGDAKRPKNQQFGIKGTRITVVPKQDTYVISKGEHEGERLYIYDMDTIISAKEADQNKTKTTKSKK